MSLIRDLCLQGEKIFEGGGMWWLDTGGKISSIHRASDQIFGGRGAGLIPVLVCDIFFHLVSTYDTLFYIKNQLYRPRMSQ